MTTPTKTYSEEFDEKFIHKGEDGDDPPEKYTWTIMGSYPIEVKSFHQSRVVLLVEAVNQKIKEVDSHGCHRCWSDDLNSPCTCESEKSAIKSALDDILEVIKRIL